MELSEFQKQREPKSQIEILIDKRDDAKADKSAAPPQPAGSNPAGIPQALRRGGG